ncbi:hypothetical protein Zmor_019786 [Zophobas morio]|uniref:Gustatory receptor n=1 Tax=Zophobas morio TaxID=2755281 RepID=A0AA38I274_9CUCU|nr:hypothetical protein Zmor_019786 [Zophobas morio]
MGFKLSTKDINFLNPFVTYLKIFAITPWYIFRKTSIYQSFFAKCYGLFLIVLRLLWISQIMSYRRLHTEISVNVLHAHRFVRTFTNGNLIILTFLTTLKSWDCEQWKILFSKLKYIDTKLQNVGKIEDLITRNFYFCIFIKHALFFGLSIFYLYYWGTFFGAFTIKICLGALHDLYNEFVLTLLINGLIRSFQTRYENLNQKLITVYKSPKFVHEAKYLARNYRLLGETIHTFNNIFGYQIILIILQTGLQLIHCLTTIDDTAKFDGSYYYSITYTIIQFVFATFNLVAIILPIHATTQEAKKFIDLCYQFQEDHPLESREVTALNKLLNHAKNFRPEFSASGFFKLDKSVIFAVIGNVATYLIITVQLSQSDQESKST